MYSNYSNSEHNRYRLGLWYGTYRLIIALCLFFVFFLTYQNLQHDYGHPLLYLSSVSIYIFLSLAQLVFYKFYSFHIVRQITLFFAIDVILFSALTFASDGPSLHISLLFVIAIFAASLLLEAKKALFITLVAVISVVYQQFLSGLFSLTSLNNLSISALLAILFIVVYIIGQLTIRRFQVLENWSFTQSLEINKLQNINRYILEQIETGYLVLDENCHIALSNPAARELLGISPLYAIDPFPLYKAQPDLFEILKFDQLKDGEKFEFDSQQSRSHIHVKVQKLIVPHQTLTLLVLQDSKRINQHAQQLKLASLGQLSASIAHEIRNPLATIVQANNLLEGSDDLQQKQLIKMVNKQAQRIDKIIHDTLSMVKNNETHTSTIHLNTFIPAFIQDNLLDIADKIQANIEASSFINFDESQIQQVLINLIRNAIRHNNKDRSHIELNIYSHESYIRLDVIDFGEGISHENIRSLFQPFFSTEITGTGLGLYLSHSFCEANQAKLSYVEKQCGACFRIECPRIVIN